MLECWCDPFPGYYLHHPSQRQPSPTFSVVVEALRYRSAGLGTARSNVAAKATGARRRSKVQ
ncbi:transcriptional regulator [Pseudomonas aeruginosa]|nr:transcriptional regulator [Pseudomonas aeruginosa]RQC03614.1 transcriptional regulator [Pseudomonas aeruginosa]